MVMYARKDLSLYLEDGESVAVIGGNGAGKSTLPNAVAGAWSVDSGSICLGEIDITYLSGYERAKLIGGVFRNPMMGTSANMQIEESLALAARRGDDVDFCEASQEQNGNRSVKYFASWIWGLKIDSQIK